MDAEVDLIRGAMPVFICPNCGNRLNSQDRTAGFSSKPRGCSKCGFGFMFELLDDYYPAPDAAFFVCDAEARIIGCGRGSFELTGLKDEATLGRPVKEVLGLKFADDEDPDRNLAGMGRAGAGTRTCRWRPRATFRRRPRQTCFPPTTTTAACCWC